MYKVRLNNRIVEVPDGTILADILIKSGEKLPHLCGGKGTCRKCLVSVNGKDELSCQYKIKSDIGADLYGRRKRTGKNRYTIFFHA